MSATFRCTWPMRTPGLIGAPAAVASGAILVCVAIVLLPCDGAFSHPLGAGIRPVARAITLVVEELAHALGATALFVLEAHLLALGLQIIGGLLVGYGTHVLYRKLG